MNHDPYIGSAVEPTISHAQIRERAYDLWDRHHRPDGYDLHFWVMAERELKAERMATLNARLATEEGISVPGDPIGPDIASGDPTGPGTIM